MLTAPFRFFAKSKNLAVKRGYNQKEYLRLTFYLLAIILFFLYPMYDGDYFHYEEIVEYIHSRPFGYTHMEDIYVWLIQITNGNYFFWRLIVWGVSFLFVIFSINLLTLDLRLGLFVFACLFLTRFSYSRVSLAMALFFFGYSCLFKKDRRPKFLFLACLSLIASYYSHKSVIVPLLLMPLTLLYFTKKRVIISLILFPVFVVFLNKYAFIFLEMDVSDMDIQQVKTAASYMSGDKIQRGIARVIEIYLSRSVIYLGAFLCVYKILINKKVEGEFNNLSIIYLSKLIYWIVYLATALSFLDIGHSAIAYRILYFSYLPICYVFTYLISEMLITRRIVVLVVGLSIVAINYRLLYGLYLSNLT